MMWSPLPVNNLMYTEHTRATTNCSDGELRLIGGSSSQEGRLEMCYERQWGTVCDDYWGTNDAKVACRQLGFSSLGKSVNTPFAVTTQRQTWFSTSGALAHNNAYFGRGTGIILLDNVGCIGGESRLLDCSNSGIGVYSSNCDHGDDAGVTCNGTWYIWLTRYFILACTGLHFSFHFAASSKRQWM